MSDTVLASLFSIAGVALGSFITIFGLWWQDKLRFKREEKKYFKRKKEEIYSTMIRWMINYAGYKRNLSKISAEESTRRICILINELNELQSQRCIFCSPNFDKTFRELGERCEKEAISPEEIQPLTKICQDELGI